ncbi:MAG: ABC transporter substrate-binding protein [Methylacidiphilales bacterium]|nr:ABC transporter substrate-binding protein [Candidatus Methylacidiphilales bacterium]
MKLTLGHSPDPDDAFMFYALAKGLLPSPGYEFEHILQDIQTLNERATRAELDITAISIHAYAYVLKDYALLRSGASMGDNYGPMVVGRRVCARGEMLKKKIAVPGLMTSAFLALQLYLGVPKEKINFIVVPFDQIFDAVARGEAELGLIIHEGQLTYAREGLVLSTDLGQWWFKETGGLPLPLGGNAVKKSLGAKAIAELSDILYASIRYGLEHRAAGIDHALPLGRGLDRKLADKFIGMYVNDLTLDYGERGKKGVREFLDRAHHAGLIPAPVELEFV